jgi:hypothetical protein
MQTGWRSFLTVTGPVYVALLWVASGVSRSSGGYILLGGLAVLIAGALALRRGRRAPIFAAYLTVLAFAGSVLLAECVLRLAPGVLNGRTANFAYAGYHDLAGGIYRRDPHMGWAMRPTCRRRLFWNGHWWTHETNAAGFRGPDIGRADAVFLGDSMIYGHGVENEQAVPSRYASRTRMTAANLGQQGTCPIQYWLRLCDIGMSLHPRIVFVCCHPNDIAEAPYYYGADELRRWFARPVDDYEPPTVLPAFRPRPWWAEKQWWNEYLAPSLRLAGAINGLKRRPADTPPEPSAISAHSGPFVPDPGSVNRPFAPWAGTEEERMGWDAYVGGLEKIAATCREHGATMVLHDLGYPVEFSQATKALATRFGVEYSPAGRVVLQRAQAGEDVYLANDGHWSPRGCDFIAAELTKSADVRAHVKLGSGPPAQ